MWLEEFVTRQATDEVKRDLELIHVPCGTHICDVQDGDDLAVHMRGALEHLASCPAVVEERDIVLRAALQAMQQAVPPLDMLGDFIGNEFKGCKVGYEPFDRCQIILALRSAIALTEGLLESGDQ